MARQENQSGATPALAALFQAQALIESLEEYKEPKYPQQVIRVSRVLTVLAKQLKNRLQVHVSTENRSEQASLDVIDLARMVQGLYGRLRFLQAADTQSCPPGVQTAISLLVNAFVPPALGCESKNVSVLVRPRWSYSPLFVDFYGDLNQTIAAASLDPEESGTLQQYVSAKWQAESPDDSPPAYAAILSFAGLDRDDVLLYPLLAHEIGHFLDYSYPNHISQNQAVIGSGWVPDRKAIANYRTELDPDDLTCFQQFLEEQRLAATYFQVCLRELTADLIATRMLGLSYFIAFSEYFKLISTPTEPDLLDSGYPGFAFRMRVILDELCGTDGLDARAGLRSLAQSHEIRTVLAYVESARAAFAEPQPKMRPLGGLEFADLVLSKIHDVLPALKVFLREKIVASSRAARISPQLQQLAELLRNRVPPVQAFTPGLPTARSESQWRVSFSDRLTAGWIYELAHGEREELEFSDPREQRREYQRTCDLIIKAMELEDYLPQDEATVSTGQRDDAMSTPRPAIGQGRLTSSAILEKLYGDSTDPLIVVPLPAMDLVQAASLDIRLGNWFRKFKRSSLKWVDLDDPKHKETVRAIGQSEIYVPKGAEFVLHPGDFVLGVSLEYFVYPGDLTAEVEGKSGLGRTGLIVATAAPVAPGFRGCIVLELCNAGTVPLVLRPGMRVAQIVFSVATPRLELGKGYRGKYQCQIKP